MVVMEEVEAGVGKYILEMASKVCGASGRA